MYDGILRFVRAWRNLNESHCLPDIASTPGAKDLAAASRGTAAVVGFIEESPSMNFYNSALVLVNGEIIFAYRKLNLPNYGVFEERIIFAEGKHVRTFKLYDFNIARLYL